MMINRLHVHWSKVLNNQLGWCFFRKHKIVKNLKRATIKQVIIHLSKSRKFIFRKSLYVTFFGQKMERTLPEYAPSILPVFIICVFVVQNHTFFFWFWMEKSADLLVSEFFLYCDLSVRLFSSKGKGFFHQCKFYFDSMYGGLDMPYGSNNVKIAKEGPLDVWMTWKR